MVWKLEIGKSGNYVGGKVGILLEKCGGRRLPCSPNPATDWLKVEFRNVELVEVFEIYDALGRLVFETNTLEEKITIPVTDFPKGTYFAVLKKQNERVAKPFLVLRR